ncbi:hypothetical protein [Angelakisella massiliensis]|uniref:hypothetical protein n=1 Tax=Angelakisella massiliensis TaxID=1871018 RepID=UPI0024B0CE72|nr:hypothetical protein [Angelakisella massiliensis]
MVFFIITALLHFHLYVSATEEVSVLFQWFSALSPRRELWTLLETYDTTFIQNVNFIPVKISRHGKKKSSETAVFSSKHLQIRSFSGAFQAAKLKINSLIFHDSPQANQ